MTPRLDAASRRALWLLCLGALAVRLGLYAALPSIVHPDAVFQYLEPAHRLVHGTGLVAWEYAAGLRSWLLPGVLAAVLWLASLVGERPEIAGWAVTLFMAVLSLVPVVCGFLWGFAAGGIAAALAAGALNAFWAGAVLYAAHPLADTFGGIFLVSGLYLASPGFPVGRRRLFIAGVLLGFALCVRIQLVPAIPIAAIGVCGWRWRDGYLPLLGGLLPPLVLLGLLDALTLGTPWQSIWLYAWINQMDGVAAAFGTQPWDSYWPMLRGFFGFALPVLGLAVGLGAYHRPLLFWVMLGVLSILSAIPHKELRFLAPLTPLVLTLAGIGTACALGFLARWRLPWVSGLLGAAGWMAVSAQLAIQEPMRGMWSQRTGMIHAMRAISQDKSICGLGFYPAIYWAATPGYAGLRPGIGIWFLETPQVTGKDRFNAILTDARVDFTLGGYTRRGCWSDAAGASAFPMARVCLWRSNTGCAPGPAPSMHTPLPPELQAMDRPPRPERYRR